jgi:predicted DNA-binding protein
MNHGGKRAGSGRKRRNTRQVVLRLSPETIERLHARASELGKSLSEVAEKRLKRL